jgi:hypothetical protein
MPKVFVFILLLILPQRLNSPFAIQLKNQDELNRSKNLHFVISSKAADFKKYNE